MQGLGTYKIYIYAYNEGFASAPITVDYTVSMQADDQGQLVLHYTPVVWGVTQAAIPQGLQPLLPAVPSIGN
jgi:hypothetical protein